MAAMNTDPMYPWDFARALCDGQVTKVCKYLVRHEIPARMVEEEEGASAHSVAAEWVQTEITHHEQTHSPLTRNVPRCLLRTLYAAHYTEELMPVAHALADAACYLLCQLSATVRLEELEVVLCSWVFGIHMDHSMQMDALAEAWRSVWRDRQVACVLLAHGFDPQRATLHTNIVHLPLFLRHGATAMGDPRLIKAVLGAGDSAKSIGELLVIGAEPRGALRRAVQVKNLDVITLLASHPRVELDECCERFPTPLMQAFRTPFPANNRLQILETLLRHGADANLAWRNEMPLSCACYARDPACVQLLLHHGADPNVASRRSPTQCQPQSPLLWFCRPKLEASDVLSIQLLLDHGADPNWQLDGDEAGHTPLHRLCKRTSELSPETVQVIKMLVAAGGDLHLPYSKNGQTPLQYLAKFHPKLVEKLVQQIL